VKPADLSQILPVSQPPAVSKPVNEGPHNSAWGLFETKGNYRNWNLFICNHQ